MRQANVNRLTENTNFIVFLKQKLPGFLPAGGAGVGNTVRGNSNISDISTAKRGYISQNIDSTDSNIFVIVFKNFASGPGNTTDVLAALQWRETR